MRSRARRRLLVGFAAAFTLTVAAPASAQSAAGTIDVGAPELAEFPKVSVSVSVPPEVTPTVAANQSGTSHTNGPVSVRYRVVPVTTWA